MMSTGSALPRPAQPPDLRSSFARWRRLARLGVVGVAADRRERKRLVGRDEAAHSLRRLVPTLHRPVFIVGAPRSGTTFLGSRIGMVADFSYHFEPRLTKAAAAMVFDGSWSEARGARVFMANYRLLLLGGLHGGLRFAEKNPENCFVLPFLSRVFPDASFVHIIRDGRDAATSLAEQPWLAARSAGSGLRGRGRQVWGPYPRFWVEPERHGEYQQVSDWERAAWCWRRFTAAALDGISALSPDRVLEVRYEHMVTQPAAVAESLADFLTLDQRGRKTLEAAMAAAVPSSVGRWRRLGVNEQADIRRQAGPMLQRLNYVDV